MLLNASSGTCIVVATIRLALTVVLCADEIGYCLRVLRDVGSNAVGADAVVSEDGWVAIIRVGAC